MRKTASRIIGRSLLAASGTTFCPANSRSKLAANSTVCPGEHLVTAWHSTRPRANTTTAEAKLILVCPPGGCETYFEEMGNAIEKVDSPSVQNKMKEVDAEGRNGVVGAATP
jgi:hypothetical protein